MDFKLILQKLKFSSKYQKNHTLVSFLTIAILHILEMPLIFAILFALLAGLTREIIHCYVPTKPFKFLGMTFDIVDIEECKRRLPNLDYPRKNVFDGENSLFTVIGIVAYLLIRILILIF